MYDIIYFGNDWYAENRTSSHHVARQLSTNNRVLYIECPGLRSPRATGRDFRKLFSKLLKCLKRPRPVHDNLSVYTLFQVPFHRFALVRALNRLLIRASIRRLISSQEMSLPILWFVVPHLASLPGAIPARAVVYYCIDDYSALPDIDPASIAAMDETMTRKADIVFLASETLLEKKKLLNDNIHLSPHGVDFEHFNRVHSGQVHIPADVRHLRDRPVIGFFGLIEEWIDLNLIKAIAEHSPEWQVLLIGRLAVSDNPCAGLTNVHFIGRRDFDQLPDYAAVFDVGILPYKVNRQVINSNPIKLREYLAAGLPVVSVRFPQVEKYSEVVSIADNFQEFIAAIEHCLEDRSPELALSRVDSVRDADWESRVKRVLGIVAEFLEDRDQAEHPDDRIHAAKRPGRGN